MTLEEELRFRRMCPYDAFGDYSDVLEEIRQKEKEKKKGRILRMLKILRKRKNKRKELSTIIMLKTRTISIRLIKY